MEALSRAEGAVGRKAQGGAPHRLVCLTLDFKSWSTAQAPDSSQTRRKTRIFGCKTKEETFSCPTAIKGTQGFEPHGDSDVAPGGWGPPGGMGEAAAAAAACQQQQQKARARLAVARAG
eukprot:5859834-Prymnesium_polylepis.1